MSKKWSDRYIKKEVGETQLNEAGSIGLLANGFQGIMAWRHHRYELYKGQKSDEPIIGFQISKELLDGIIYEDPKEKEVDDKKNAKPNNK